MKRSNSLSPPTGCMFIKWNDPLTRTVCILLLLVLLSGCSLLKRPSSSHFSRVKYRSHWPFLNVPENSPQLALEKAPRLSANIPVCLPQQHPITLHSSTPKPISTPYTSPPHSTQKKNQTRPRKAAQDHFIIPGMTVEKETPHDSAFPQIELLKVLAIALAVILPPLAFGLVFGGGTDLWLNILLTLLGWFPGVIHAIWNIVKFYQPI